VLVSVVGGYPYAPGVTATLIGYARCSTDDQDLTAQRQLLLGLGVAADRIYLDHGLTGTNRRRPGLDQALAAVRAGDTLVVSKLDRLARSVPDARDIGDSLVARGVRLSLGSTIDDPSDPMGKMFFNILATFAEFEVDLLRMRTREGMAVARAKGEAAGEAAQAVGPAAGPTCCSCTTPASTPSPTSPTCSPSPGRRCTGCSTAPEPRQPPRRRRDPAPVATFQPRRYGSGRASGRRRGGDVTPERSRRAPADSDLRPRSRNDCPKWTRAVGMR
jgi:hypothetical protein